MYSRDYYYEENAIHKNGRIIVGQFNVFLSIFNVLCDQEITTNL